MNNLKTFINKNDKNALAFFCMFFLVMFGLYGMVRGVFVLLTDNGNLSEFIGKMTAAGITLWFLKRLCPEIHLGFRKKGLFKGLFVGFFMLWASFAAAYQLYNQIKDYKEISPYTSLIVIVVLEMISVSIFEEVLFRGMIMNHLLKRQDLPERKRVLRAIIISGALFGISHALNLIMNPTLINYTTSQIFYTGFIGVFLGAVYYRCNNIFVPIILHACFDLAGKIPSLFFEYPASKAGSDWPVFYAVYDVIVLSSFLYIGLYLLRNVRTPETTETREIQKVTESEFEPSPLILSQDDSLEEGNLHIQKNTKITDEI